MTRLTAGAPQIATDRAESIITAFLGPDRLVDASTIVAVPGETDANFMFGTPAQQYVLKVSFASDLDRVILQQSVFRFLKGQNLSFSVPEVVAAHSGEDVVRLDRQGKEDLIARVLTWVPGEPLGNGVTLSGEAVDDIGSAAGSLANALRGFECGSNDAETTLGHYWDLDVAAETLRAHRDAVPELSDVLDRVLELSSAVSNVDVPLPRSLIHNDLNVFNVLTSTERNRTRVSGIIDFGDMIVSTSVNDLAILIASVCRNDTEFISSATRLTAAYHVRSPLTPAEIDAVFPLVLLRLASVLATTARLRQGDPRHRSTIDRTRLSELLEHSPHVVSASMRHACGLPPTSAAAEATAWIQANTDSFSPVVHGHLTVVDRSADSTRFDGVDPYDEQALAAAAVLELSGADQIGIGRYGETLLSRTRTRRLGAPVDNLDLAVTVLASPGTELHAPLGGRALVIAGELVIDHHEVGAPLWTRIRGLSSPVVGQVAAGDRVGDSDGREVSVQLLTVDPDLVSVPWNTSAERLPVMSQFALDASAVLGSASGIGPWQPRLSEILDARHRYLPRTHPTYFDEPLDMTRAHGVWFYDEQGRRYLDALNNVTLLGHCHPRVTAAAARQLGRLQTNSRFVYDSLTDYTSALVKTLPDSLEVVYMLNSGSEANDLALRMARYITGREDIVVIEDAYHGYTTVVSDVSPSRYKHYGKPETTHPVPNPDRYRGEFGYDDPAAGSKYAAQVIAEFDRLIAAGRPPAAFIYEALLAGGGQVVLPPGYLHDIHIAAEERGILTIADEVQVGFGRLGSAFWGFQTQGPTVVPDFVSMGKSMGNGFPVAAMVTTRKNSERFDATGRFFSTYGGNPTACVVAGEVLAVLEDEGLQANAETVGEYLRSELWGLADKHDIIGDVRGQGFYSGVEFVTDRTTKNHARDETLLVCNRMKDDGVLVYPTGPEWNILKIKPPLSFTRDNADLFVDVLDGVLSRGW